MTTWVLLRGLMRDQRYWGDFTLQLQQTLPPARIVALDFAGNGAHYRLASAVSVADMLSFCREQLRAQGLPPPYRVFALSLGAMVAVEWCARHPEEIEAGVLVNTSMRPFSRFYHRLRWQNYPALLAALCGGAAWREALILRLTSRNRALHDGVLAQWLQWQRGQPVSARNALRQLLAAARYRAPTTAPTPPLLVLASARDALVDCRCSQALVQAWNVAYCVHPDAGHDLPLDDGSWAAQKAAAWAAQFDR